MRFESFVYGMTVRSVKEGLISQDQAEIYEYGLHLVMASLLSFIIALIWGLAFECLAEVVAFLVVFIPLRMYTGGYHASTYLRCLLAFISMLIILTLSVDWIPTAMIAPITVNVSLFTLLSVFLFAPIQHQNAPIKDSDRPRFKRIARIISLIDIIAVNILLITPFFTKQFIPILFAINCGLLFVSVLIIIGKITQKGKEVSA